MPCDTYGGDAETISRQAAAVRELEALLCEVCTAWPETPALPDSVQAWWTRHQLEDEQRRAQQRAERHVAITRLERQRAQVDAELAALRKAGR